MCVREREREEGVSECIAWACECVYMCARVSVCVLCVIVYMYCIC